MKDEAATHRVVLASSSPRRKELLSQAGIPFSIVVSGCDETPIPNESAREMVERLALVKAQAVAENERDAFVVGADTTVFIDGEALGKPESATEARQMLAKIAGRTHEVWGGIAIVHREKGFVRVWSHMTKVTMVSLSPETIAWYVQSGEPMDKAGAYAIQGLGLQFVENVEGSYSNVVGLNISELVQVLEELGVKRR
jgi:septum formation protein